MNELKNAIRITGRRFSLVWTILLYYTVALILMVSIGLSILLPYINAVIDFNLSYRVGSVLRALADGGGIGAFANELIVLIGDLLGIFNTHAFSAYALITAVTVISRFILGLADIAFYDIVNAHCTSAAALPFSTCFVKNLGKGALWQLNKLLFILPVDIIIGLLIYAVVLLSANAVLVLFSPFLIMLTFILLYALRLALFAGWAPGIVNGGGMYASLAKHAASFRRNFRADYAVCTLFTVAAVAFNLFFGIFTLGVGFILTVPITRYVMTSLNCVLFYRNNGKRYYIDKDIVINPL
jgi:hypothetical protein